MRTVEFGSEYRCYLSTIDSDCPLPRQRDGGILHMRQLTKILDTKTVIFYLCEEHYKQNKDKRPEEIV